MEIDRSELVEAFGEAIGEQKAEAVIEEAAQRAGIGPQRTLSKDEALDLFDAIADEDGVDSVVRVSARTLKTQIRSGDITA